MGDRDRAEIADPAIRSIRLDDESDNLGDLAVDRVAGGVPQGFTEAFEFGSDHRGPLLRRLEPLSILRGTIIVARGRGFRPTTHNPQTIRPKPHPPNRHRAASAWSRWSRRWRLAQSR